MAIERYIDQTLLRQDATEDEAAVFCEEAVKNNFRGICISPCFAGLAREVVGNSGVQVGSVVGFPLGNSLHETKLKELSYLSVLDVDDIDFVWNVGLFKSRKGSAFETDRFQNELREVAQFCQDRNIVSKCIVETSFLTKDEKLEAFWEVWEAGFDFIKTSTGFFGAAQLEDINLWSEERDQSGLTLLIKASGGIKDLETTRLFVEAGADLIGTSQGVRILQEELNEAKLDSKRDRSLCKNNNPKPSGPVQDTKEQTH